ncbi:MAG: dTDP-4-dehydrorhamnose 3,5-epimerase family protein, partial [Betaproteobacteria bacterium]
MKVTPTALPEVLLLEPRVFGDARGFFMESFNARVFREATGVTAGFVQDNHSQSRRGVLRGIHYQVAQPQGKLVRVVTGAVLDVAVDLRRSSPRFGQSVAVELTADNRCQL